MQIKQNPFVSDIFITKWLAKFNSKKPIFKFNFIDGLSFFKSSILPIYINAGKNLTKGISYSLIKQETTNFNKSLILIYDVPDYLSVNLSGLPEAISLYRIKQYPGYLTDFKVYKDLNDYLQSIFSKKTRDKFKRYEKRLELCFDVKYKMYYGDISKVEYDFIFDEFRILLEKRFDEKQISNNNLDPDEWEFYYEVAYHLIKEKKASLFVVYQGSEPIAITLNYLTENTLFHGITVFDIDYSKFHIGKISLKNLFLWCFDNQIQAFDFSKGYFDYKTKWMNLSYNYEYHLFFDKSSIRIKIMAFVIKTYFDLKQFLRDKEWNKTFHRLTFWFKKKPDKSKSISNFNFSDTTQEYEDSQLLEINLLNTEFKTLKRISNEFLFLNKEALKDLRIFKVKKKESTFLFKGKKLSKLLVMK